VPFWPGVDKKRPDPGVAGLAQSLLAFNHLVSKGNAEAAGTIPAPGSAQPCAYSRFFAVMNDFLVTDTLACLAQGIALLRRVSPAQYARPQPECFHSSLGGHFRHNLDHYTCYLEGLAGGRVDYDARTRDSLIETDPAYAAGRLEAVGRDLQALQPDQLAVPLSVRMDTGSDVPDDEAWTPSSGRRELQFLLSHTIHHYALIAVICHQLGVALEPAFGVAPSTLRFQQSQGAACAR